MGKKTKNIGIVLRHAPYGSLLSQEALDATLATSVYGQTLHIIFMSDGVFQLIDNQNSSEIQQKSLQKQLSAFELYDIDKVFVCEQSLIERGIPKERLLLTPKCLNQTEVAELLHQQDTLLTF